MLPLNSSVPDDQGVRYLSWIDYVLLSATLLISLLIGIYFGLAKNKARTTIEYLFGGKSINVVPIALSLVATQISGNTMVAVPSDVYKFGSIYLWVLLGDFLSLAMLLYIFLPIYFNLKFVSIYEYLELRFDKRIRSLISVLNLINAIFYSSVVIYIPALAFSQMTGLGIYPITITVCAICILYTTFGGFKAVIWTDAFQFFVMVGSMITIFAIGATTVGGLDNAIKIAAKNGRFDILNFSLDLTSRNTFWAPFIGNIFFSVSILNINQTVIQKYLALSSYGKIKKCAVIHIMSLIVIKTISLLLGNVVFAKYAECDVFKSKKITKTDQLIPYFVMDITKTIPGLSGLFLAALFSACLSTISSSLNSTAANVYEDLLVPFISKSTIQRKNTNIIKAIVVILGVMYVLMMLLIERVGGIFPFTTALQGIIGGPILGIFVLGLLFPSSNTKGAFVGALSALMFTGWIILGNTWYQTRNLIPSEEKPTSTAKCDLSNNQTMLAIEEKHDVFILYRICFWYYTPISTGTVVIVGSLVSWFTKEKDVVVNPDLVSSAVHCLLPKRSNPEVYYNVSTAEVSTKQKNNECDESSSK